MAAGVEAPPNSDGPSARFRNLIGAALDSLSPRRGETLPAARSAAGVATGDRMTSARVDQSALDLLAAADLCTELGKVSGIREAAPLLERAAKILDAVGLIVWIGNPQATELTPALAHGYSDKVLAQLPKVKRDDDHATAAAFRSAQTSIVNGSQFTSGALVVPLMTPGACAGVLAIELRPDTVRSESVRAMATIFAAQLSRLIDAAHPARAADRKLA
jgi:hypothetical protein